MEYVQHWILDVLPRGRSVWELAPPSLGSLNYFPIPSRFRVIGATHLNGGMGEHSGYAFTVIDPLTMPVWVGAKLTLTLHFVPSFARHDSDTPASRKSPLTVTPRRRPPSSSTSVATISTLDVEPTVVGGKVTEVGLKVSCSACFADSPTICGLVESLSTMVMAPGYCSGNNPERVVLNAIAIWHEPPGESIPEHVLDLIAYRGKLPTAFGEPARETL